MEVTHNNNNKYMNLEATELRLGLPGRTDSPADTNDSSWTKTNSNSSKRPFPEEDSGSSSTIISSISRNDHNDTVPPPPKAQIVGWPPIRSYRKNNLQPTSNETSTDQSPAGYVKLSMDGAPYLRKIDLNLYTTYPDLLNAMEGMFKVTIGKYFDREGYNGGGYTPTYEDRDGDWMLVGDVPWTMFVSTCKRLRIMKSSEAKGLGRC